MKSRLNSRCMQGVFALSLLSATTQLSAGFALVADFEGVAPDNTAYVSSSAHSSGLNTWGAVDPVNASNKVLSLYGGTVENLSSRAMLSIPTIADNTTGTVFFRFAIDDTSSTHPARGFIGLSNVPLATFEAAPASHSFGNNLIHMNFVQNSAAIQYRDAATAPNITTTRESLTWYSVWIVANNTTNISQLYIEGGEWDSQTLVTTASFRTGVAGSADITSVFVMADNFQTVGGDNGRIYLDDIYVDLTGSNLTTVPEPSTYAILFGALTLGFVFIRRRTR